MSTAVLGLGIAPANQQLDLNKQQNITYRIYNTEGKDFVASITYNGTLAKYISIDKEEISFDANDKYKTFTATIEPVKKSLYANIMISDEKTTVTAKINIGKQASTPTAQVIRASESDDSVDYIIPIVLGVVIAANIIYFISGRRAPTKRLKSPAQMIAYIQKIDNIRFREHVNASKNDFADLANDLKLPELAYQLYDINSKEAMVTALNAHMSKTEPKKSKEELKTEITELKHELDTFDFSEFEKHL